jgi:hypothetical protein
MIVDRLAERIREAMTEAKLLELHNCEQLWRGTAARLGPHTCTGSILEVPLETR